MNTTTIKLVTIIAEGALEHRLLDDVLRMGAHGYTVSDVRGRGTRGITASVWHGAQVKIETLVGADVAARILDHLAATYFADYAVVAYSENVEVVRAGKYV